MKDPDKSIEDIGQHPDPWDPLNPQRRELLSPKQFEPCYCKLCQGNLPAPCRYGVTEPLTSNQNLFQTWNDWSDATRMVDWFASKKEIERLRADLDNERAAMRNVQECAESYRMEVEGLQDDLEEVREDYKFVSEQLGVFMKENERLRAALERITALQGKRSDQLLMDALSIAREALRPADETKP